MALDIPLPTASPQNSPEQYVPLLLSAIEGFLLARDVWGEDDYPVAYNYMQELMEYTVKLFTGGNVGRSIGEIIMFPTSSPPDKWLVCDGAAISRMAYAELFAVLSTDYGAGDGITTFNIPDFRDYSPMGIGTIVGGFGAVQGALQVTLDLTQVPVHSHTINDPGHDHTIIRGTGTTSGTVQRTSTPPQPAINPHTALTDANTTGIAINSAGGGLPHDNLHPVIGTSFLIYSGVA